MNFSWPGLPKPFFALAPMEGATDTAFRQVVAKCGKPDVMFTEFANVEGLTSAGRPKVESRLKFESEEQPLIAQIWGLNPDNFYTIAQEIVELGFAGVDINMACPVRAVTCKGAGGALIKNPGLAKEIIAAVKSGVKGKIPVSVKTRIGYKTVNTEEWIGFLLEQQLDALTVHGRTVAQMSKVPADWNEIAKVVELRDQMNVNTIIIGNGDVLSIDHAVERSTQTHVDGVMIGRGIFHNPWLFTRDQGLRTRDERIELLLWHIRKHEELYKNPKSFDPLKRFFKIYIQSFDGASELREQLMACKHYEDVYHLLDK